MRAHEFDQPQAAGCILYAEDTERWGLQQRSDTVGDPGVWAAWGGGREPGESLEQCVRRELAEESGYGGPIKLEPLARNAKYVTFIGRVPHEFEPRPCNEWKDYCWVDLGKWPDPLHPGVAAALKSLKISNSMRAQEFITEDHGQRRTAELLVRELEAELAEFYDTTRGSVPAAYKDQVRRRIEALNQELLSLGFKYAPTAPGRVAPVGTRFVEGQHSQNWSLLQISCVNPRYPGGPDPDLEAMCSRELKKIPGTVVRQPEGENISVLANSADQVRAIRAVAYRLGVKITATEPLTDAEARTMLGEDDLEEGWKQALATGALAAAAGLGGYYGTKTSAPTAAPQPVQQAAPQTPKDVLVATAKAAGLAGTELAAFLAQAAHETTNFAHMEERGSPEYFAKKYESPRKARILGNKQAGDGERYKGRGFVQLTGRYNYTKAGQALGIDLVNNPRLAADPVTAAKIAVWYWGSRVAPRVQDFTDTAAVTKTINPGMKHQNRRQQQYAYYKDNPHESVAENFADGRKPGRKGLAKRMGVPTKASVTKLRSIAKNSTGEKARMAHWMANMKSGKKKK